MIAHAIRYTIILLALSAAAEACCSSSPKAAAYAAELQACVANASTLADSQACRCRIAKRYDRPCDGQDGGAP